MIIAIAGASGFIGKSVAQKCKQNGTEVIPLSRQLIESEAQQEELSNLLSRADVVLNVAGAPVMHRWSKAWKANILNSRVQTTNRIITAMKRCTRQPALFISASAVGIYKAGMKHNETQYVYDDGFLGQVCRAWEQAANEAGNIGVRTVILRLGVVLGKEGGVLQKLYPLFRNGLGAVILPASSPFPFIHIDDLYAIVQLAIENQQVQGVINCSSHAAETQLTFARAFARALKKPLLFAVPGFLLSLLYGKGASVIYKNPVVESVRLREYDFFPKFDSLSKALVDIYKEDFPNERRN